MRNLGNKPEGMRMNSETDKKEKAVKYIKKIAPAGQNLGKPGAKGETFESLPPRTGGCIPVAG